MVEKRIEAGRGMVTFSRPVRILSAASVVGKNEREGPLGDAFDLSDETDRFGQKTWEKAESEMQRRAFRLAMKKGGVGADDVDVLYAGDLLNQCVGSAYGLLSFDVPYFGLYGACSTAAESILLAGMALSAGYFRVAGAVTSSHYCSAERQYRTPIEYGGQRTPTAQWTVTGSGAFLLTSEEDGTPLWETRGGEVLQSVYLVGGMPGIVVEKGISDAANMGAAMAPAVLSTLVRWFRATGTGPADYDLIVSGDLGYEGVAILRELLRIEYGIFDEDRISDCGCMIYSRDTQDTHAGGSGCGCSAVVLASWILPRIERGDLHKVLLIGSGAMMSPGSIQQGEAIPAVGHLIALERRRKGGAE
ncbi:MAG: stage V sporulation protein AD [Clostridia bacterium]|nr:stage V sporulation protein AD [Clostridia bacterium]